MREQSTSWLKKIGTKSGAAMAAPAATAPSPLYVVIHPTTFGQQKGSLSPVWSIVTAVVIHFRDSVSNTIFEWPQQL